MGYSTEFKGELKFKRQLLVSELSKLNVLLGCNTKDFGDRPGKSIYINLKLTNDFSGIQWDGSENTYHLDRAVNFLINDSGINLKFQGELLAQGDDYNDRWRLVIKDGCAVKIDEPRTGTKVTCPFCERFFRLEDTITE